MSPAADPGLRRCRLPWPIVACLCACQGAPTRDAPRPLDAPVVSARRLYDQFLAPAAIGRRFQHLRDVAGSMLPEADAWTGLRATTARLAAHEVAGVGRLPSVPSQYLASETARCGTLPDGARDLASCFAPDWHGFDLALHELPLTLHLAHRPLGESDDLRHRVDPEDDRPEASTRSRILRRILP